MSALDRKAADLRVVLSEIMKQSKCVDTAAASGPHAEMSLQELRIIEFLGDDGPHMMRELAEFLNVAVNSVTTIVDGLEAKALVQRNRSDQDRRVVRVELTDGGHSAYQGALQMKLQVLRRMLGALTEEEQETFMILFRKIARAGRSQIPSLTSSQ
jgi:DNA-binding MarR family transcriptional regulator